ncbi:predicted protein [Naegleria gruberi]|uniref:Predicted protein n=1 Tax=Naegleria gruberi TaxID=5762 RepID=D2VYX9_NAEGR|nr:uncharacterized protein NAEGRDRAFT_74282 [Naegleria gruberi]EFC38032.1 predicted protein [Naegleria gruberi]|eukprot:XP_002670776.1 predicted protein [Naegleria gruberi strain NEG-M]
MFSHLNHGIVAIDFGGSHCRVAVYLEDHVEYIPNKLGNYETPTCIAFVSSSSLLDDSSMSNSRILIGEEALEFYSKSEDPYCLFWDFKQLIGKACDDEDDELILKSNEWPFRIIRKQDKTIRLSVCKEEEYEEISVNEMIGLILKQLKEDAERYLKRAVTDLVVSIPNYFSNHQRIEMKKVVESIGVTNSRLVHDTSAACFQYIWKYRGEKRVFVFDLGRSGCSASVFLVDNGVVDTKSSDGLPNHGGAKLDESLVSYCCEEFYKLFKKRLQENPVSMRKMQVACEEAKKKLSTELQTQLSIKSLMDGIDFEIVLTRSKFEDLNTDFFSKCLSLADKVIRRANCSKEEIADAIIIGGGCEIPKLKQLITTYFCKSIHPRPIYPNPVVFGAAIQGGILANFEKDLLLIEVTSRNIGCEISIGGDLMILLKKDNSIPCSSEREFSLPPNPNNQKKAVSLKIYEGDSKKASDNELIGIVKITEITELSSSNISLTFGLDTDGILYVQSKSKKPKVIFESTH